MKVLCGLLAVAIFVMATIVACEIWSAWIGIPAAALVVCYFWACIVDVQPKTAIVIVNLFGGMREARQGWQFVSRPFEWLGEINGSRVFSRQNQVLDVNLNVESQSEEVLTLNIAINFEIADLTRFLNFSEDDFRDSVREHAKALASERARTCKGFDELMDQKAEIEKFIRDGFRKEMPDGDLTLEEYHGIAIDTVVISDPELPEAIMKAGQEKEIAKKRVEAQVEEARGFGKATNAIQGRTKKGQQPAMSKEKASELELVRSGKIKQENKTIDIGPNLKQVVDGIPKGFLGLLGSMFGPKGGKRKGKKGGRP